MPAPRTSLLNKTPSLNRSDEKTKIQPSLPAQPQQHLSDDCINVTVTEIDDGQKSIISISGRPSISSELEAEIVASSGCEADIDDDDDEEDTAKPAVPAVADEFDDVFEPVTESTRIEDTPPSPTPPSVPAPATPIAPLSISTNSQPDVCAHESVSPTSAPTTPELSAYQPVEFSPTTAAPADSKPPILAVKPGEKVRLRSIGNRMDVNSAPPPPPSKPTIVCDQTAGTMKVNDMVVVMRRKPVSSSRDEEPELMKVFARRSLKLKEPDDGSALSGEELECSSPLHKSRDSDKENEDGNSSPPDERKRKDSAPDSAAPRPFAKFQRSISHDMVPINTSSSDRRQRCKSTPDEAEKPERHTPPKQEAPAQPKIERPPPPSTPAPELTSPSDSSGSDTAPEERVTASTPFKRIQQRREEWEKRAQQAMKIHGVK